MKLKELYEAKSTIFELDNDGNLKIENMGIKSLMGCPWHVPSKFHCFGNELTSLEGGPKKVGGEFSANYNNLKNLKFSPEGYVEGFHCNHNNLISLEGITPTIYKTLDLTNNKLTSLKDIHKQIKYIGRYGSFAFNPITSHVLGLLLIDGLQSISLDNTEVQNIINKYLKNGKDVIDCQNELMDAGFDAFAQL